jgi:hypothetical protein
MTDDARLPNDIDALKALLLEARAQLAERDIEIEQLKAQIDKFRRMQCKRLASAVLDASRTYVTLVAVR